MAELDDLQAFAPDGDLSTIEDHRALIRYHDAKLRRDLPDLKKWDRYVEGEVPLKYMAPEIQAAFGDRITQLVMNIAQLGVESYENRLDIDGILLDPVSDADDAEAQTWEELNMQQVAQQVHYETLALGRAYTQVGEDDNGGPVVTAESPFQMTTMTSPLGVTKSAVKRWLADDERTRMRSLMLADRTLVWEWGRGAWQPLPELSFGHDWGRVPVFTFLNRQRLLRDTGAPQFKVIVPLYEALNKMATDMMVGGEFHALPRRWATNVAATDFEDESGNKLTPLQELIGAIWHIPGERGADKVEVGQFAASDLSNFHETIKLLMQVAGHLMGLPAAFTAFATDNPAAEGAIKAGEIQLIKGTERKQTAFGVPWKGTWQTVMRIRDGDAVADSRRLKFLWRNAATPTVAQMADAAVKLVSARDAQGRAIVSAPYARRMMGLTAAERDALALEDQAAMADQQLIKSIAGTLATPANASA